MRTPRSSPSNPVPQPVERVLLRVAGEDQFPVAEPYEEPRSGDYVARAHTDQGVYEFVVRCAGDRLGAERAIRLRSLHDGWRVRSLAVEAA